MAFDTSKSLRNKVMYSVFVRNYSEEGTFEGVRKDLQRIKELGVDIIWLMPIHPLGEKARKGSLGSPYAIKDYRAVNPEFGTLEDLKRLVEDIHAFDMKCIIDVVYNHTSPDSWLSKNYPQWFYHKPDGSFGNRVGDWTDIIDLDYSNLDLWDYQIETLKMWAEIVDGFRCDVASLVPLEFWLKAREEVGKVRENCIWLSESIEHGFIRYIRSQGMTALSDSEIYQAFDIAYDYDTAGDFVDCLLGKRSLADYARSLNLQETIYPDNYVKLRFLENHDRPRAHQLIASEKSLRAWTAFLYFQKGMPLIYNGQEVGAKHLPTLFDKDTICWDVDVDLTPLMQTLYKIRKDPAFTDSDYTVSSPCDGVLCAVHKAKDGKILIDTERVCLSETPSLTKVTLEEGDLYELYSHKEDHSDKTVDLRKNLFILSAPSATGKNTVLDGVRQHLPKVKKAVTATTRKPRKNEKDGADYYFYNKEEFKQKSDAKEFVEVNFYDNNLYDTPISEIERHDINTPLFLVVDFHGMREILSKYPLSTTIFLMPPSIESLYERIRSRGDNSEEEIERRILEARLEIKHSEMYDYIVKNDNLEECVKTVSEIIKELFPDE